MGQYGPSWAPIAAEQTGAGYYVVWKNASADQYGAWSTDISGNYTANIIGTVSGSSSELKALESTFQQDLNGDGVIGVPAGVTIEAFGSTTFVQAGGNYYLYASGTSSGPSLKYAGTPVSVGQYGPSWAPIAAEQTGAGYNVVWKNASADQYGAWSIDISGNYTANIIGTVSGSSSELKALESTFHQDLNGDGVIGVTANVTIEAFGSTTFVQAGGNYYLYANGTSSGPSLKYAGTPVSVGQYGPSWAPIAAEQTGAGYNVVWKNASADQYGAWSTDISGNYTANIIGTVSGSSSELKTLESSFQQDLNGDGVIGVSAPVLKISGPAVVAGQYDAWAPIGAEKTASGFTFQQDVTEGRFIGVSNSAEPIAGSAFLFHAGSRAGKLIGEGPSLLIPSDFHSADSGTSIKLIESAYPSALHDPLDKDGGVSKGSADDVNILQVESNLADLLVNSFFLR